MTYAEAIQEPLTRSVQGFPNNRENLSTLRICCDHWLPVTTGDFLAYDYPLPYRF